MNWAGPLEDQTRRLLSKIVAPAAGVATQAVTIARPRATVERFWRDPDNLSAVLDGIAQVTATDSDRLTWSFAEGTAAATQWVTHTVVAADEIRFVGSHDSAGRSQIRLLFADAPKDLGTEVTIRVAGPLPKQLTAPAAFTALYRARALLQTGEAPTLAHNPSGRRDAADQEA
ncbi:hypothetical protein ACFO5K_02555 [Nocardia halotolerans]|uniref:Polyketide cyclase / dehydrase and lipid transport n=1 Tax=Nocardia halotolerans TaxID=1755878 RepID=A0ABV8VCL2_9NOCA